MGLVTSSCDRQHGSGHIVVRPPAWGWSRHRSTASVSERTRRLVHTGCGTEEAEEACTWTLACRAWDKLPRIPDPVKEPRRLPVAQEAPSSRSVAEPKHAPRPPVCGVLVPSRRDPSCAWACAVHPSRRRRRHRRTYHTNCGMKSSWYAWLLASCWAAPPVLPGLLPVRRPLLSAVLPPTAAGALGWSWRNWAFTPLPGAPMAALWTGATPSRPPGTSARLRH